ncbi:MAG: sugar ABC transporter substrate-binding protein [Solirubrobacterales bacterium]|nr:sugar ABC transporter substrate-binding protein [Solirubrobacterales bacterium]
MSDSDILGDAIERLEWDERKEEETPFKNWRQLTRRTALTGGAAGMAAVILQACGGSSSSSTSKAASGGSSANAASIFGSGPSYKFTLVNHVTTNPFFTPTQNGASDACKLLGCSYSWTGSQTSNVSEMVNALNSAVSAGANGVGVSLVDLTAFNAPVSKALSSGIPVVAYNADAPTNPRLAYIGQDLYLSGQEMGTHIANLVPSGDVALFIATPGALNIQPRINGALATLKSHSSITPHVVATGAAVPAELSVINSYATGHPNTKGYFAVDAGSTQGLAQTIQKLGLRSKGVKGGGYDLTPVTEQLLAAGEIDFTIDQQPYLQGFYPILQLYTYNITQKLTGIADVNTGLKFLDKTSIGPYNSTKSRYEGTGTGVGVQKA